MSNFPDTCLRSRLKRSVSGETRLSKQNWYKISLNLAEGRIIFQALAELPFKYVYELIGKINHQANQSTANDGDAQHLQLDRLNQQELQLMIRALEEMPYSRVHKLVANLNTQMREQIEK